ncbi:hypothetical protein C0585_03745 [Candidatus Woesearchaeota archaeon]|nr:MAG: hypothetical protein C0585_03745 [Candidatus Woesearchaeota archaeon]
MKIRLFKDKDKKQIENLIEEFLDYTRESYAKEVLLFNDYTNSQKKTYVKKILEEFQNKKNSQFLIAEKDSKTIGFILGFVERKPYTIKKRSGHILSFFVSEKNRNDQIGKNLYNKLVEWFIKQKCDHLELDVYKGNDKSIEIYKKWGFKENLVKMKKELS